MRKTKATKHSGTIAYQLNPKHDYIFRSQMGALCECSKHLALKYLNELSTRVASAPWAARTSASMLLFRGILDVNNAKYSHEQQICGFCTVTHRTIVR